MGTMASERVRNQAWLHNLDSPSFELTSMSGGTAARVSSASLSETATRDAAKAAAQALAEAITETEGTVQAAAQRLGTASTTATASITADEAISSDWMQELLAARDELLALTVE